MGGRGRRRPAAIGAPCSTPSHMCIYPAAAPVVPALQDFGEHGREYISSELGLLLMRTLADPSKLMNVFGNDEQRGQRLAQLLQGTVFKVGVGEVGAGLWASNAPGNAQPIACDPCSFQSGSPPCAHTTRVPQILPMENEGGRKLVEAGKLCERKNGRGVDPNRNWPLDWGKKEKDYDPNEEFPGRAPFRCVHTQHVDNMA